MTAPLIETASHIVPPRAAARVILRPRKALHFTAAIRGFWRRRSTAWSRWASTSEHQLDVDGQVVELLNDKRKFIAYGIYNSRSRIAVRLYTWNAEEHLDEAFLRRRLEAAIELRRQIGYEPIAGQAANLPSDKQAACRYESATRLVFSESDGLSGLVIDRYGDYLVVQPTSLGMAQRIESVVGVLQDLLEPNGVVLKLDKAMAKLEGIAMSGTGSAEDAHPNLSQRQRERSLANVQSTATIRRFLSPTATSGASCRRTNHHSRERYRL